jgi:starch phosphorylase
VHIPTWLGLEFRACLDEFVPDWNTDNPSWELIRDIPDERLWGARVAQRKTLVAAINAARGDALLAPDALTIVWARRFAEYKRPGLLTSDPVRLSRLLGNPNRPVQIVVSGKAHPRDQAGKVVMQQFLQLVMAEPTFAAHIVFLPDYNISLAQVMIAGADVWLNTPRKPLEASGTSGMKSSDNGGLQLTVRDGWAAEVDWWQVGWGIDGKGDADDASELYDFLENGVIPAYYDRDNSGVPHGWVERMKNTMVVSLSRYSSRRMMLDYAHKLYLPLVDEQRSYSEAVGT